jgi:hypothetical protein
MRLVGSVNVSGTERFWLARVQEWMFGAFESENANFRVDTFIILAWDNGPARLSSSLLRRHPCKP